MKDHDYQREVLRTMPDLERKEKILNMALGLCGESGEVADIIKKHIYQGHDLCFEDLADELGDVLWYLTNMATAINISLSYIKSKNVDKLKERYPEGFDIEKSRCRNE